MMNVVVGLNSIAANIEMVEETLYEKLYEAGLLHVGDGLTITLTSTPFKEEIAIGGAVADDVVKRIKEAVHACLPDAVTTAKLRQKTQKRLTSG
jgi:hypothetical protein